MCFHETCHLYQGDGIRGISKCYESLWAETQSGFRIKLNESFLPLPKLRHLWTRSRDYGKALWSLKGDVMLIGHGRQRTAEAFLVLGRRAAFVVIGEGTPLSR
jgi:hypothetical protein